MKRLLARTVLAVATVIAVGLNAAPAFASGPYTNTSTAVRHCTYLPDASCAQIKWYIPANTPVSMRCWTDESTYAGTNRWFWIDGNGVQGFVSAANISSQTTVGWCNNMPEMQTVRWAGSHLGEQYDVGWCLQFVHDAWINWGPSIDSGSAPNAVTYWNTNPHGYTKVSGVVNAPIGALVFWGATAGNPDGHVAVSIGDDYAISTYEYNTTEVHVLNMDTRNALATPTSDTSCRADPSPHAARLATKQLPDGCVRRDARVDTARWWPASPAWRLALSPVTVRATRSLPIVDPGDDRSVDGGRERSPCAPLVLVCRVTSADKATPAVRP
jgi:hypothetical protein